MHTKNHTKSEILAIFQSKPYALGVDYLKIHSPLEIVQLQKIVNDLLDEGHLLIIDKYHWQYKGE